MTDEATKIPVTERGRRTRARLVTAARKVFEESGFLDARITDIAATAGVAYGTFYTYFATKEDVFREVANAVQHEGMDPHEGAARPPADGEGPLERIERANRRYLEAYQRNARLMAVIEQVATFNSELLQIRVQVRQAYVERSTRAILRWQADGLADPALDARYAASALGSMVDRFAYVWLVLGDQDFEMEPAVRNLSRLWAQALGLPTDGGSCPDHEVPAQT
jgi:AcrR family transcriptional regulator